MAGVSIRLQIASPPSPEPAMLDSFGAAMKAMRDDAGLSLSALAARANVSKPALGRVEKGTRPPTISTAQAVDRALRGGGVLVQLAAAERKGDDVRRRVLLATIGTATAIGALDGPHTMGDLIRHGLLNAAGAPEDWDQVVADSTTRLVTDPSPLFGAALLTNLALLSDQITGEDDKDRLRAAAGLGQVYGLWLGNQSHLGGANHWYRSSAAFADKSGDPEIRAYVRGRSASRGIYEGWTVAQTRDWAGQALAVTARPTLGALEAHAALVSVHALTGDVSAGRAAARAMADVAGRLPDSEAAMARAIFLSAFMECRIGNQTAAMRACDEAEPRLAAWPMWLAETRVYRGRALVAGGDVRAGLRTALAAVEPLRHGVRVIGVAVRDVLSVVPAGHRSDELAALTTYADPHPGPWETIR